MGGDLRDEIAQNAYIKFVPHALKHKSSAVNGILIGRVSSQNDVVEITDSVLLFHSQLGLLPQLEISLILIEEHFADEGVGIVGYFHANERFDDRELRSLAKNVGDHIYRYLPEAAVLLLDNKKLAALSKTKDRGPVVQNPDCRESDHIAYWLARNHMILDCLLAERSSIICLQELWIGNEELVNIYEKRLGDAGYLNFKLGKTNNRGDGSLELGPGDKDISHSLMKT